jgi:hypothetical protein
MATLYKWRTRSENGSEPCSKYKKYSGKIKTLDEWRVTALPGLHPHCHCRLEPVESGDVDAQAEAEDMAHTVVTSITLGIVILGNLDPQPDPIPEDPYPDWY